MIQLVGVGADGTPLVVLGIDGENVTRLVAGEPLLVDVGAIATGAKTSLNVSVVYGKTHDDIIAAAQAAIGRPVREQAGQECRWCARPHEPRLLCDPAKRTLDALYARGMEGNMPTIEFPEPIPGAAAAMGLGTEDSLVKQIVVKAGTIPVAGVTRPVILITGRDVYDGVLPQWVYSGTDEDMRRTKQLFIDMIDLAVRTARKARASGG